MKLISLIVAGRFKSVFVYKSLNKWFNIWYGIETKFCIIKFIELYMLRD